jgi:hypothetical protein
MNLFLALGILVFTVFPSTYILTAKRASRALRMAWGVASLLAGPLLCYLLISNSHDPCASEASEHDRIDCGYRQFLWGVAAAFVLPWLTYGAFVLLTRPK